MSHLFLLRNLMRAAAPPTANTAINVTFIITWTYHRAKHAFKAPCEAVRTVRTWQALYRFLGLILALGTSVASALIACTVHSLCTATHTRNCLRRTQRFPFRAHRASCLRVLTLVPTWRAPPTGQHWISAMRLEAPSGAARTHTPLFATTTNPIVPGRARSTRRTK